MLIGEVTKSTESGSLMSRYYAISSLPMGSRPKCSSAMVFSRSLLDGTLFLPHEWLQSTPKVIN
jgi:hypothetical protein